MIRRDAIKRLRAALEEGNLQGKAMLKAGLRDVNFIYYHNKYMYQDRLRRFVEAARARGQEHRDDIVEDIWFKRLAEGKASGSEYEFYLCNRRGDKWKKIKENTIVMQNTTHINTPPAQIIFESIKREAVDAQ